MILPGAAASKKVGKPKKASKNEEGHKYCFDGAMSKDQFGIVIVFLFTWVSMNCPVPTVWFQIYHNIPPATWMLHFIGVLSGGTRRVYGR